MTTYALPAGIHPQAFNWGLERKTIQHQSSITGAVQSVDLLAYRWIVDLTLPARDRRDAGAVEAFFNTLIGGYDRLTLHRADRPVPLGTMRGTPTLNASVLQFSDTLVLAGAWDTSRQNLLTRSQDFDNSAWDKSNCSVTANSATAPDGTSTADHLYENTVASVIHRLRKDTAFTPTITNTFSVYAKAGVRSKFRLYLFDAAATSYVQAGFDLGTGSVLGTATSGTGSGAASAIESAGGGWYRCSLTGIAGSGSGSAQMGQIRMLSASGIENYTGDGSSGFYVWGAQIESGSSATQYIATTSAASYALGTLKAGEDRESLSIAAEILQTRLG